jgi:hypothetical protein
MASRVKRTYNLAPATIRRVKEMAEEYGVAPSQDAVIELAVDELGRRLRDERGVTQKRLTIRRCWSLGCRRYAQIPLLLQVIIGRKGVGVAPLPSLDQLLGQVSPREEYCREAGPWVR